jgi:hypothetical protein
MSNFVFYKDWLENIKDLPIEIQDKIIADIVRYGVEEDMAHTGDATISMAVNFTKRAIDVSKEKYQAKIEFGKNYGKAKKADDKRIYELARSGMKSNEIAAFLGISKSSVDHSEGWKQRKSEFNF